ncbi:MAG TPA: hypothetical protein DEP66_03835 [Acidimicrobiaceae bacterium]|nr:hypothetical protein [Acidimicrobiaceae bacterium]HCB37339.1 hypothetical protein [Acidimicrobiaceae bacterium]
MMATILTLIILGMVFQGLMIIVDNILDTVKINDTLKELPIIGQNLNVIWAYAFVAITALNGDGMLGGLIGFGSNTEVLSLGRFGMDIATALALVAFIPVRDAVLVFIRHGIGSGSPDADPAGGGQPHRPTAGFSQ